jgi:hypothetical protein
LGYSYSFHTLESIYPAPCAAVTLFSIVHYSWLWTMPHLFRIILFVSRRMLGNQRPLQYIHDNAVKYVSQNTV